MNDSRLPIWSVNCGLLDAILALSFEPLELQNLLDGAGVVPPPPCRCLPPSHAAVLAIHGYCHDENPISSTVARQLDAMHRRSLRALEELGFEATLDPLLLAPESLEDLPGRLWAIGTSRAPEAPRAIAQALAALSMCGLRLIAERSRS